MREPTVPRLTVVQALRRSWLLVAVPAVLLAAIGGIISYARTPTYTSEAQVSVGKANVDSPAFGGFVGAAAQLATVYSRSINAPGVVAPVSQSLHLSQALVASRLSASPLDGSPIIRVIGTGTSAAGAEAVANAGAATLTSYVTQTLRSNPDATRMLNLYNSIARQDAQNSNALSDNQRKLAANPANAAARAAVITETAQGNSLKTQQNALSSAYLQALSSQAATDVLSPLSNATSAISDRSAKVQSLAGVGLLAGLVIGVGLAMWRANNLVRRRLMA